MDAKEFRLGNLVYENCQYIGENEGFLILKIIDKIEAENNFIPIKLTKDILSKIKYNNCEFRLMPNIQGSFNLWLNFSDDPIINDNDLCITITYLHEYQNIYFMLTNTNFEYAL